MANVTCVLESDSGVDVSHLDADGIERTLYADRCVVTTQYDVAERIWPRLKAYAPDYGRQMFFARLMDIKLGYSAPMHRKAYPGFYGPTAALSSAIPRSSPVKLGGDVFGAGSMEAAVVWGEHAADRLLGVTT